ncbi:MAG: biopolymer transporter ExbD [Myxococcota bacterium]
MESGELNLIPYLDVVTTLVIFLVFTFQVVIEFRLIELLPPAYSANARNNGENPEDPKVTLTLLITETGYRLATNQPDLGTIDIPKTAEGYDNDRLSQELLDAKRNLGLQESMVLMASDKIEYQTVVSAMDAAREYEGRLLFPDVLLAKPTGIGGGG